VVRQLQQARLGSARGHRDWDPSTGARTLRQVPRDDTDCEFTGWSYTLTNLHALGGRDERTSHLQAGQAIPRCADSDDRQTGDALQEDQQFHRAPRTGGVRRRKIY